LNGRLIGRSIAMKGPGRKRSGSFAFGGGAAVLCCPPIMAAEISMGMFDNLMGNLGGLEAIAQKVGLEPEQMQGLLNEIGAKIGRGETSVSALAETAAEHGVSADALQQLLGQFGGPEAILGKLGGFLDRDGDGNPLNELSGLAKGLFG